MPKYLETTVLGEVRSYPRATHLELINTDPPEARVHAVDRTTYPTGEVVDRNPVQLDHIMTDPAMEIPVIDLETYEPTEATFTAGYFQLLAASVAMWKIRQHKGVE